MTQLLSSETFSHASGDVELVEKMIAMPATASSMRNCYRYVRAHLYVQVHWNREALSNKVGNCLKPLFCLLSPLLTFYLVCNVLLGAHSTVLLLLLLLLLLLFFHCRFVALRTVLSVVLLAL